MQPKHELPSSTRFGQFRNFGKIGLGGTVLPDHPLEKTFCMESEFLFVATCTSDLTIIKSHAEERVGIALG